MYDCVRFSFPQADNSYWVTLCCKHTKLSSNEMIYSRKCKQTHENEYDCQHIHSVPWGLWLKQRDQTLLANQMKGLVIQK